jgi:hypothetical protein
MSGQPDIEWLVLWGSKLNFDITREIPLAFMKFCLKFLFSPKFQAVQKLKGVLQDFCVMLKNSIMTKR